MDPPDSAALAHLRAAASSAVAIEALWDGDTQGWFVELSAVVRREAGFEARFLRAFRRIGDIRLFNGDVPPWPEALEASEIGTQLASLLGLPFHFPAADHPEQDCPHWWDLSRSYPCGRCSMPLLQTKDCRWRGLCYYCHLALEREAGEAGWSAEERQAPRCSICGSPAVGEAGVPHQCQVCRATYRTFACVDCGMQVMIPRSDGDVKTCSSCSMARRLAALSSTDRSRLREAARVGTPLTIIEAQEILRCGLGDVQDALAAISAASDEDR